MKRYSADLLYQAQMAFFDALEVNNETLHGIEAVVQLAFAAGLKAAQDEAVGAKTQWGIRRAGFKTVRITSDTNARSLLRNFVVPAEMVMREVGPWEVVAANADVLDRRNEAA